MTVTTNLLNLDGGGGVDWGWREHKEKSISVCVSSLECFTKAVSSTRCHTVWPIRETCGESGCVVCMSLFVCLSVVSGGLRRSAKFLSGLFHFLL